MARPITVLVVDDEFDIRHTLHELFRVDFPRARVFVAESGAEAIQLVATRRVDLVLADYRMPGMTGLELLTRLRETHPRIGRVLFTAFPDTEMAITATNEAKIHAFLRKPIEGEELVSTVARVVRERRAKYWRDDALERAVAVGVARYRGRAPRDA